MTKAMENALLRIYDRLNASAQMRTYEKLKALRLIREGKWGWRLTAQGTRAAEKIRAGRPLRQWWDDKHSLLLDE